MKTSSGVKSIYVYKSMIRIKKWGSSVQSTTRLGSVGSFVVFASFRWCRARARGAEETRGEGRSFPPLAQFVHDSSGGRTCDRCFREPFVTWIADIGFEYCAVYLVLVKVLLINIRLRWHDLTYWYSFIYVYRHINIIYFNWILFLWSVFSFCAGDHAS